MKRKLLFEKRWIHFIFTCDNYRAGRRLSFLTYGGKRKYQYNEDDFLFNPKQAGGGRLAPPPL